MSGYNCHCRESLWPSDLGDRSDLPRTPCDEIKTQSSYLLALTKGKLMLDIVRTKIYEDSLRLEFTVFIRDEMNICPRIELYTIDYMMDQLYPVEVKITNEDLRKEIPGGHCAFQDKFLEQLKEIQTSGYVSSLLSILMAHADPSFNVVRDWGEDD